MSRLSPGPPHCLLSPDPHPTYLRPPPHSIAETLSLNTDLFTSKLTAKVRSPPDQRPEALLSASPDVRVHGLTGEVLSEVNVVALVKLSDSLNVEWSEMYGMAGGHSQMFDILVDNEGNYLMGGHTTVADGM